jgi:hypothetical protein
MGNAVANQQNVAAALADYNTLRPQKSGTDTMAAITAKYSSAVADAVRAQVASGAAPPPTPPAASGPAAGAYGFSLLSPSSSSSAQGDLPRYAPAGADNTRYSTLDRANQAANPNTSIPLVGWSAGAPFQSTGLAGLSQLASYARSGATTYYTMSSAWQAYVDMPTDQRIAVQKQLLASGKYTDPKYYPSGTTPAREKPAYGSKADPDTFTAFSKAFELAAQSGIPLEEVLGSADAAAQNAAQLWQQNTQIGQFTQTSPEELYSAADTQAISILGRRATADEKALIVSLVQGKEIASARAAFEQKVGANRSDLAVSLAGGIGSPLGGAGSDIAGGGSPATLNALVSAIGGQESGSPQAGGYGAVNKDSGAFGRFQFMPDSWKAWARAAGVDPNNTSPGNQEIVARNQISILLKNGNGDPAYVAVAWYSGEETAKAFQADPSNPKWKIRIGVNGKPDPNGKYPSIAEYAQSIAGKVASATPGTLATQSMVGQVGNLPADTGTTSTSGVTHGSKDPNYPYPPGVGSTAAAGALGGATGGIPTATPIVDPESGAGGAGAVSGSGQPTPAQLLPTSEGIYTSVNPVAEIQASLRNNNPLTAGAVDIANVLDAVHAMFKRPS